MATPTPTGPTRNGPIPKLAVAPPIVASGSGSITDVEGAWNAIVDDWTQFLVDSSYDLPAASYFVGGDIEPEVAVLAAASFPPDWPALAAGLAAAFVLIVGFYLLANPLNAVLTRIPLIGIALALGASTVWNWMFQPISAWTATVILQAAYFLWNVDFFLFGWRKAIMKLMQTTTGRVYYIWNTTLPQLQATAYTYAVGAVVTAEAYADNIYANLHGLILYYYSAATGYTDARWNELHGELWQEVATLQADDAAAVQQAAAIAGAAQGAAEAYTNQQIGVVELERQQDAARGKSYTDTAVGNAVTQLQNDIAPIAAAAAAAGAGLAQLLKGLPTQCIDDMCNTGEGNAQNLLKLMGLIEGGAVFAFLAACINQPKVTADTTAPILTPFAAEGLGLVDALVTTIAA